MGKVYTTQSKLVLYVNLGTNLLEASSVRIAGTNPSGVAISPMKTATIEDATKGLVSYQVLETDFTVAGTWTLWTYVSYVGGTWAYGEPFPFNVYTAGN